MDFYSMLLAKKLKKESGGGVSIESLVATENGNYSETGKAYSPVIVNVPFPENGYLLESASGQAINITDGAPLYLQECKAEIESVQEGSGEPSPTNVRPISGQTEVAIEDCGKNLFNKNNIRGYGWIHGATGAFVDTDTNFISSNYINVSNWGGKQITINKRPSGTNPGVAFYDANKTFVSGQSNNNATQGTPWSVTIPTNAVYMAFCSRSEYLDELQLEHGDTATTYEPYNGRTYTIQLGDTIYGGELDVVTGELTVTHRYEEYDGSSDEEWFFYGTGSASAYAMAIYIQPSAKVTTRPICNYAEGLISTDTYGDYDCFVSPSNGLVLVAGKRDITSVDDWKTYLASNPLEVVYELAEPSTIQLTPQQIRLLESVNNLSCNTGELNIEYFGKGVN